MLSKEAAELSLSYAQAFSQTIEACFIDCACVDEGQRP
jgi:hypothetical protein